MHDDPNYRNEEMRLQEEMRLRDEERRVAAANRNAAISRIVQIIYYLTGALAVLLLLRVLLRLFGANPDNQFAQFIYSLSNPFVGPFINLFGSSEIGRQGFEVNTLVAIVAYAILAWLVGRLVWLIGSTTRS